MSSPATTWNDDEFARINSADELQIASRRDEGSLSSPRTIWMVEVDGDLYVRSVNGPGSVWFRATRQRRQGRIQAGGVTKDVAYTDVGTGVDPGLNDRIDAAYRTKYHRYSAPVDSITSPQAATTTMRLTPQPAQG